MAYLQRYPACVPHFKRVMSRKIELSCRFHTEQDKNECLLMLTNVITLLCSQGLLNDEIYLESRVKSLRKKGTSSRAIQFKLQQKGLLAEDIGDALESNDEESDLSAAITFIRRKKLASKEQIKQLGSLARAGFSFEIARKALELSKLEN